MSELIIEGGAPLCGVINVQGSKNSALPILAAVLLTDDDCFIENCPDISDTHTAIEILRSLGCRVTYCDSYICINPKFSDGFEIDDILMRRMRSSLMFLGPLLSRKGHARISFPGGCDIGTRPIDLHLSALTKMGVTFTEEHGYLDCKTNELKGAEIGLSFPSVGATENVILAGVLANGETVINNAAKEPEIFELQEFLNKMGADIKGAGSSTIFIKGVKKLSAIKYRIMPDRIAAGTYLCAVAATGGNVLLKNVRSNDMQSTISLMRDVGCIVDECPDMIRLECVGLHQPDSSGVIRTMPFPGFPTDMGSPFVAMMCVAKGITIFTETIFENRYKYLGELLRMGAKIRTEGRVAVIEGVKYLYGAHVEATDLRGGAALVVAALSAKGRSVISNAEYIQRGYEHIEKNLSNIGANIKYVE